jgi:general secretion pathway protein G
LRRRAAKAAGDEQRDSVRDRASRGFSLIELLVVLVVLAIVSAIVIPTLLYALNKGRQVRTVADLRHLGSNIEVYSVDYGRYPAGSDITALGVLVPEYLDNVANSDAWGHELIYTGIPLNYTLGSPGKDGGSSLNLIDDGGPTTNFNDDIVYSMGRFVQWPEGTQE